MSFKESFVKKLQQSTCDKTELNRQVLRIQRSLREIQKVLSGTEKHHKSK